MGCARLRHVRNLPLPKPHTPSPKRKQVKLSTSVDFPPFFPATNNAGFTRDEANVSREENPVEFLSKKVHLDTSAIALDAVISGMPGLHHHLHDQVLHAPLAPLRRRDFAHP